MPGSSVLDVFRRVCGHLPAGFNEQTTAVLSSPIDVTRSVAPIISALAFRSDRADCFTLRVPVRALHPR